MRSLTRFMSPTTHHHVPPWPFFCETTCNSVAPLRHLVAPAIRQLQCGGTIAAPSGTIVAGSAGSKA